jgi:hypothetical protein
MNRNLINDIIRRRLMIESMVYLTEDRIPSIITKFTGLRTVKGFKLPHEIVSGSELPEDRQDRKEYALTADHDFDMRHDFFTAHDGVISPSESIETNNKFVKHVVGKIAELDPTDSKEYTERMVHWYSKSKEKPLKRIFDDATNGMDPEYRDNERNAVRNFTPEQLKKHQDIHAQLQTTIKQQEDDLVSQIHPFKLEDFGRAAEAVQVFHRVKQHLPAEQRDFNKINSLKHLEKIIAPHRFRVSKSEQERTVKSEGADLLYEDDDIRVQHVKKQDASCSLGAGTRWCISATRNNYFDSYNKSAPLILFTDKKGKFAKSNNWDHEDDGAKKDYKRFMFHFGSHRTSNEGDYDEGHHSFMDENDDPIDYNQFVRLFPQTKNIPHLQHQHAHLFQSENREAIHHQLKSNPTKVDDIVKHVETKAPLMVRKPSEREASNAFDQIDHSLHSYIFDIAKPWKEDNEGNKHLDEHHPVSKYYLGTPDGKHKPRASSEGQEEFTQMMRKYDVLPSKNHMIQMIRDSKVQTAADYSKIHQYAARSPDPEVHSEILSKLNLLDPTKKHNEVGFRTPRYNDMILEPILQKTRDVNIIRRAHDYVKKFLPEKELSKMTQDDWNLHFARTGQSLLYSDGSGRNLQQHIDGIHKDISLNPHTPDDVLMDIVKTHGVTGYRVLPKMIISQAADNKDVGNTRLASAYSRSHYTSNVPVPSTIGIVAANQLIRRASNRTGISQ